VQKAKNLIRAQYVDALQTNLGRAMMLTEFLLYDGDAALINTELERYMAVGAHDVQRVAQATFTPQNRTTVEAIPAKPPAQEGAA
jgi:zinc protease